MKQATFGQNSTAIKFEGRYEDALVDCIFKNTYDILRKDRTYDLNVRPNDWPGYGECEEWIKSLEL